MSNEQQLKPSFLNYVVTKRRSPPGAPTEIGDLWVRKISSIGSLWVRSVSSTGIYTYGLEGVLQFLNSPDGRNLNEAELVDLALMAESSQCFAFALGLWAKAYGLENDIDDINHSELAAVAQREYLAQFRNEIRRPHGSAQYAQYNLDKAQQQIQLAIARQEEFENYRFRIRSSTQITHDIRQRWESRIAFLTTWYHAGVEGAQLYLQRDAVNIETPKLYGLAMISEQMGYPALAHGFWATAYNLDTGKEAPPYIDISELAVDPAMSRHMHSGRVSSLSRNPVPPPTNSPPELEEGGYWDERFKGVDI
jgi:hypothetical protein